MDYEKIIKELEEEDFYALSKTSIYRTLRSTILEEGLTADETEEVVSFVMDLFMQSKVNKNLDEVTMLVLGMVNQLRDLLDADFDEVRKQVGLCV